MLLSAYLYAAVSVGCFYLAWTSSLWYVLIGVICVFIAYMDCLNWRLHSTP